MNAYHTKKQTSDKKIDMESLIIAIRSSLNELKIEDDSTGTSNIIKTKVEQLFLIHSTSQSNTKTLVEKKSILENEMTEWKRKLKFIEMVEQEQQEISNNSQEIFTDMKSYVNMKKELLWILEDNIQIMDDNFHEREEKLLEEKKTIENQGNPEKENAEEHKKKLLNEQERLKKALVKDEDYLKLFKHERTELVNIREKLEADCIQFGQKIFNVLEAPVRKTKELKMMEERLEQIKKKFEKQKKKNDDSKKIWKDLEEKIEKAKVSFNVETQFFSKIKKDYEKNRLQFAEKKNLLRKLKADQLMIIEDKNEKEEILRSLIINMRENDQIRRKLQCEVATLKNEYKKFKEHVDALKQSLVDQKNENDQLNKKKENLFFKINETKLKEKTIIDEQKFGFLSYENYKTLESSEKKNIESLKSQLIGLENLIVNFREVESRAVENCQEAAELRSAMSRKSCAAQKDLREIQEELAIKELLIFDSNKKNQVLDKELSKFKKLYESVKNERNGYVSMLQVASQNKAEIQELFKSLQREIEILNNNLGEKNKKCIKIKNDILLLKRLRDKRRHKLNKYEERKKKLEDNYLSLTSEIMKMTNTVKEMDDEVVSICRRNDISCEQRNALGQELVKINEEYCIVYNKFNIKTIHFKNSGKKIEFLSKNTKFLDSQIVFMTNKNFIFKQKCLQMPNLAQVLIKVQEELVQEKKKEKILLAELEDPEKNCNLQPVRAEDLDENLMDVKIKYFEVQINLKKDIILQKTMSYNQIDKLLKEMTCQVESTRYEDLKNGSLANSLKYKFSGVFKKVMVLVSELSIFQANVIMLEMEKKNQEETLLKMEENVENGNPPLVDSELKFLKKIRNTKVEQEAEYKRKMEVEFVKNIEPYVKKTTAQKRVDSYINNIGLPQPYGIVKPFMPVKAHGNLRFYRNPISVSEEKENVHQQ